MSFIVYKIVNKRTGLIYIGSTAKSLEKRWQAHICTAKSGGKQRISVAIREYGPESFETSILKKYSSREKMKKAELWWIKKLNSCSPNGYNIQDGSTKGNKKIEVHLPLFAAILLDKAAKANKVTMKKWMECILIAEANKAKKKKIDPHTAGGGYNEWHLSDMQ